MNEKLEKKIQGEIHRRVLSKYTQQKEKQEREKNISWETEATIEALVEITDLNRSEIEAISTEIRTEYEKKFIIFRQIKKGLTIAVISLIGIGGIGIGKTYFYQKANLVSDNKLIETKVFKNPMVNGYYLDYCREWSNNCGLPAASAYCQANGYTHAINYKLVHNNQITQVISSGEICDGEFCDRISEVTCTK